MARKAKQIKTDDKTIQELTKIANSRNKPKHLVERCKMVLGCIGNQLVKEIAKGLKTYPNKVIEWRDRFTENGIKGLKDMPREGRPPKDKRLQERVLELIKTSAPKGFARWDASMIAKQLNASKDRVWRIIRKEGIHIHRKRSWCISTDKEFAAKAADIIGLYLSPPENAFVVSVDEKPSIQALERRTGFIETNDGKIIRAYKSTYKRNGTLNLFAALEIATGRINAKGTKRKTRQDFIEFMDSIEKDYENKELHVILDNYCTHKKNDQWLEKHPNVHFHFTPTSASWLNQVEIWFGILSRKSLDGMSFSSTEELKEHIIAFTQKYNESSKPFKWRKREVKGSQIKNNIENLCN